MADASTPPPLARNAPDTASVPTPPAAGFATHAAVHTQAQPLGQQPEEKIAAHAPHLAVIDPGMGNLRSVCRAWEAAGAQVRLVRTPDEVGNPDALIFPGQGGMPHCMDSLQSSGLADTICGWIREDRPFFGICLGMQALFEYSEEGNRKGLGVFPGKVERFRLPPEFKIPHMGWNAVSLSVPKGVRAQINDGLSPEGDQFYFVHSYHVTTPEKDIIWGETSYGYRFVSAVAHGNCFATQFHPEKSQAKGLQMYRNYVKYLKN